MISYHGRRFIAAKNSDSGEVSTATTFDYHQQGTHVWATYSGGQIARGHLLGTADAEGNLSFDYHHLNTAGELRTGRCTSTPRLLTDGRLRLIEQ
jgi:hypothetical protein